MTKKSKSKKKPGLISSSITILWRFRRRRKFDHGSIMQKIGSNRLMVGKGKRNGFLFKKIIPIGKLKMEGVCSENEKKGEWK